MKLIDIFQASKKGDLKNLLAHKAYAQHEIDTALKYYSKYGYSDGYSEIVKILLDHKANIYADDYFALRKASENGHTNIVKILLEYKANVHAQNNAALLNSSQNGHTEVVKLLLDHKADIHADNDRALQWSSQAGHTKLVQLLLDHKANVHANNSAALLYSNNPKVIQLLILHGAYHPDIISQHIRPRKLMELFVLHQRLCKHELTTNTQLFHKRDILDAILRW